MRCSALTKRGVRCSNATKGRVRRCKVHSSNKSRRVPPMPHRMRADDVADADSLDEFMDEINAQVVMPTDLDEVLVPESDASDVIWYEYAKLGDRPSLEDLEWFRSQPFTQNTFAELKRRIVARESAQKSAAPPPPAPKVERKTLPNIEQYVTVQLPWGAPPPVDRQPERERSMMIMQDMMRALPDPPPYIDNRAREEDAAAWAQIEAARNAPRALPRTQARGRGKASGTGFFGRMFGRG
eukprot:jgi/Mesvir1/7264/Mv19080-RA.1